MGRKDNEGYVHAVYYCYHYKLTKNEYVETNATVGK